MHQFQQISFSGSRRKSNKDQNKLNLMILVPEYYEWYGSEEKQSVTDQQKLSYDEPRKHEHDEQIIDKY